MIPRRSYSVSYLTGGLSKLRATSNVSRSPPPPQKPKKAFDPSRYAITPLQLNEEFRSADFARIPFSTLAASQGLFNRANVALEWTLLDYQDIPDVKYLRMKQEHDEPKKTTFGIRPELLKVLPEVILLGHTNAGKSSLINNLLVSKNEAATAGAATQHAYVSRTAGFTKTLNCFNVAKKLRLVDSPGYGEKGQERQGDIVLEYLERRHQLRRAFVLIDSEVGFRPEDRQLLDHLIDFGMPFEVVFTKVDRVVAKKIGSVKSRTEVEEGNARVVHYFRTLIESLSKRQMVYGPRFFFNNALPNKYLTRRYGFKEIRGEIYRCTIDDELIRMNPSVSEGEDQR